MGRNSDSIRQFGDVGAFFRGLVETSPEALAVHLDGRFIYVNPATCRLFGADAPEQLIGRAVLDLVTPEDRPAIIERIRQVTEDGAATAARVFRLLRLDGSPIDTEVIGYPFELEARTAVQVVMRDVTTRLRAERALAESEEKFERAFHASPNSMTITSLIDGRFVEVNAAFTALTGVTREQALGRSGIDFGLWSDPVDRARVMRTIGSGAAVRDLELPFFVRGEPRVGRLSAEPIEIGGEPCVLMIAEDVTERRRAQMLQTATWRISEAAHSVSNLDELLPAIHHIVADLMPAKNFYIALYDAEAERLEFPYYVDEVDSSPGPVALGKGLTEYVLRTRQPLLASPAVFHELLACGEVEVVGAPSIDWLGVPLEVAGKTTGVLVVQSYTEGVRFSAGDKELLRFVCDQVAMAIERRRADDARQHREALLRHVAESVSAATGDAFFRTLALELATALGVEFAFVGGLESVLGRTSGRVVDLDDTSSRRAQRRIVTLAVASDGAIGENFSYDLAGTPCNEVVGREICVHPDGVAEKFPLDAVLRDLGVRCYLGVPLFDSARQPLGLLVVMGRKPLRDAETARALLKIFAVRAAAELERVGSEAALRSSEERYRVFVAQSSEAIWCVEFATPIPVTLPPREQIAAFYAHGYLAECNAAMAAMYGYEHPAQLIGTPLAELLPASDSHNVAYLEAAIEHDYRLVDAESHEPDRHGIIKHYLNNLVAIVEDGHVLRAWGTQRDITERRDAEVLLQRQAAAIRASMDGLAIFDGAAQLRFANDAYAKAHGHERAEDLGEWALESGYPPTEVERWRLQILPEVQRAGAWRGLTAGRRRDGALFPQEVSVNRIEGGGMVVVVRDVSERRSLEEQLRQAQKMEAVGRLAGGVAHDFNNLLTAITGYSDLLLARLGSEHPLRREIEEIKRAGVRAADLTRQLLAFSRRQVLAARVVNLNRVVTDMEKLLRRVIGEDIELAAHLDPALGAVRADPGQLEQVILNLAVNARDAMPHGGTLTLATRNATFDAEQARRLLDVRAADYVVLEVGDNGGGISAEAREHIFEPFFTTKEVGRGTGLGLSMVYGIVRQSDGHIEVDSTVENGTVFRIYLPRIDQQAETGIATPAPGKIPSGHETVLVVEDEPAVQQLVRRILEDRGYRVIVAPHGAAALLAAESIAHIDLLLTDVVMPGMSGPELAEQLRQKTAGLAVLYMSGYTESFVGRHGLDEPGEFLQKPFTPDVLAQRVRSTLDARGGPASAR